MPLAAERFEGYLTRHYAQLGDQAKHRAGKKRQLLHTYERYLPADRSAPMLEIGPGFGQLLELLRRDLGYEQVSAVDASQEVVEFCNRLLPASTTQVDDTVAYLARRPDHFQRVFACHVLEHLPKPAALALVEAARTALQPGGLLVVEVPNMANLFTGAYLRHADFTHEEGYTEHSLRHLLETGGFTAVTCFEEGRSPGLLKGLATGVFRGAAALVQRAIYRGYELPVPRVLTAALCAVGQRPLTP